MTAQDIRDYNARQAQRLTETDIDRAVSEAFAAVTQRWDWATQYGRKSA